MACCNNYLPIPPRAWSRVQNSCLDTENNGLVKLPYSNKLVDASLLGESIAMLNKGNVLQYKANSSNLTQAQKYSKIAQGKWTNRNTTWATQNLRGNTNPNTTSLKRSGNVTNIAIDPITGAIIGQTTAPVTCPQPIAPVNEALPSSGGGGGAEQPETPPPVEPTPASDTFPPTITDTPVEPIVIQDGGVLICSVQENICTGETNSTISQQLCNPTSDSDVPGTIQLLCWNDGTPTWYPRQRYVMTNSTNKWPTNYKFLTSAVKPYAPVITSITNNGNSITITWIQDDTCLPASQFDIYQNGALISILPNNIFTSNFEITDCGTYSYFIIAVTNGSNIPSNPSNIVSININVSSPPESVIVNWASANFYDTIMDINMNFTPPLVILCGDPSFFVVNVLNSNSNIIASQDIAYLSGNTSYEVNFNDIPYAATGSIEVYLVTIDSTTGNINSGDIATCNFISSDLPIYINPQINSERTELSFNVITQTTLAEIGGIVIPDLSTNPITITKLYWTTNPPGIPFKSIISKQTLANNELKYSIKMYAAIVDMNNFPDPVGIVTSNQKGVQPYVF